MVTIHLCGLSQLQKGSAFFAATAAHMFLKKSFLGEFLCQTVIYNSVDLKFPVCFFLPDCKWSGKVPVSFRQHVRLRQSHNSGSVGLRWPRFTLSLPKPWGLLCTLPWNQGQLLTLLKVCSLGLAPVIDLNMYFGSLSLTVNNVCQK